jgi:putative tryptophan/tyrosine transport system substrate-binding protein
MKRREFITLVGSAAAWPFAARAQQTKLPVIGFLDSKSVRDSRQTVAAFHRGLNEAAFVEGQNVAIEYRWADNQHDRIPVLVADLVQRKVALIAAPDIASAFAAKAATSTIPIVFNTSLDPVAVGLVASLNRPGGNVTGITSLNTEVASKRLELLHEVVPKASTIGLLVNQANQQLARVYIADVQAASRSLALQILVLNASSKDEIDEAFAALAHQSIGALVIAPDPLFNSRNEQLADLGVSRVHHGGRPIQLRDQPCGHLSPDRNLYGEDSQGRKPGRASSLPIHKNRADPQSEDREAAWSIVSDYAAWPRRRGDRIGRCLLRCTWSAVGTKRRKP